METHGITIEPAALKHAEAIQRLISDPLVAETTSNIPHPYPEGGAEEWIRHTQRLRSQGAEYAFAILNNASFVGSISILNVHDGQGEVGYWIGRPYWGRGYATAAGRQVVAYGFEELGLSLLIAKCLARNPGSFRVLEKLGFQHTGFTEVSKPKWPTPERVAEFVLPRAKWVTGP